MPDGGRQRAGAHDAEADLARSMERLVASDGFAHLLARVAENVVALHRLASGALDLVVRNLRLAGRQDLARLGRQVGRAEDKLERVLQEVEELQQPQARARSAPDPVLVTRRAAVGGAALTAVAVGAVLVALHPPSLAGVEEALALAVGAVALVLASAWMTLVITCRGQAGSR